MRTEKGLYLNILVSPVSGGFEALVLEMSLKKIADTPEKALAELNEAIKKRIKTAVKKDNLNSLDKPVAPNICFFYEKCRQDPMPDVQTLPTFFEVCDG